MSVLDVTAGRCPDEVQVARILLASSAPPEERAAFLAHLAGCEECRLLAGALAGDSDDGRSPPDLDARATEAPPRAFANEEVLDSRYEILNFIARGGMGEVYRANDRLLGEIIALKTVRCDGDGHQEALARFRSEVQLARRVTHPNVCRILEFGLHERSRYGAMPFFTMPFLDGETIGRCLARRGKLSAAEVGPLIEQIAAGLEAIHREGIVHRDLKSENVFLLPDTGAIPRVILMDFGLARPLLPSLSQLISSGNGLVGTPAYVAPELLLGKSATVRTDIYSLGVLMFEMLTGRLPFNGATAIQAAARRLYTAPPRLREIVPSLDGRWDDLVGRCLQREEDRRPSNVGELLSMLPARSPVPERPVRRGRLTAVGVMVAATSIGALVGILRGRAGEAINESRVVSTTSSRSMESSRPPSQAMTATVTTPIASSLPADVPEAPSEPKERGEPRKSTRSPKPPVMPSRPTVVGPADPTNLDVLVNPYD